MSQNVKEYGVQILPLASSYLTADAPLDAASGAEDATAANGSSVTLQYAPAAAQPDGPLTDPTGLPKDIAVLSSAYQSNFASSGITEQQYAYSPTGTDITFSGPAGITGNATPFTGSSWTPDNNDAAFVQDNGSISKQLTNLQPGGWYAVTFAATGRPGFAQQTIQVTMDGTVLGTFSPGQSPNYQGYVTQAFYATSGTHTLTIQGLDPNGTDQTALIDNLQVVQVAPQFQDPSFSKSTVNALSFQYQPTLNDGWTFVGGAGVSGSDSGFTGANPLQSVNERILFLQGAAQASQSIDGFQTNTAYTVTFDAAARANFGSQVLEVDVDGQSVGTFNLAATSYTRFTTNAFMPGSGQHAVTFRTLNGNDVTALVRGVSLNTLDPTLQNTSFAGTLPASGYAYAPSADAVSGWNFVGGAGVTANGTAFTGGNPASPDGANVAFLQGNGATISQQVYGFQQRVPYQLTFSAAQRASNTEAISVQLLVDGNVASTFTPPLDGAYHTYTLQGSVAPGTHTIALRSLDPDGTDQTIFIDAPTLTPQMGQALYGEDTAGTMTALDVVQGTLSAGAPDVYDNNGNVLDPSQLTGLFDGAGNLLGASGVDPTDGRTYVWNFSTQQKTDITDYGITSTAGWLDLSQQAVQDETPQHSISIPDPFGGLFDPQQVEAGWDQATQDEIASIVAEYQYAYEQQQAGATPSPLPGTSPIIPRRSVTMSMAHPVPTTTQQPPLRNTDRSPLLNI
jgi:hypothetical protein